MLQLLCKITKINLFRGPLLFIQGGMNEEQSQVFGDMALYDIPNKKWIGVSQQASNK